MDYKLFFLILSASMVVLSIVTICTAPNINGGLFDGKENCRFYGDYYSKYKDDSTISKVTLNKYKEDTNICKRKNAMHDLEFSSLIIDVVLGTLCCILGLLHYFDVGKVFVKVTGIIGLVTGVVGFVLTIIYVGFSAYIFNNDPTELDILYENGAYVKMENWNSIYPYKCEDRSKDYYCNKAKYKDFGKKQYNYNSDLYKDSQNTNSDFSKCKSNSFNLNCEYIWDKDYLVDFGNYSNKYMYDRWLTSIILSCFIFVCAIGVAIFGLLLFLKGDSSGSGHTPM